MGSHQTQVPAITILLGAAVIARPARLSRRALLAAGATGLATAALPSRATPQTPASQTPKRSGTLNVGAWDPPHFDHILAHVYRTHVVISFTHSRLLKHKAGPGARPGTFPIEGDLAESWRQVTTYEFKLRRAQSVSWCRSRGPDPG